MSSIQTETIGLKAADGHRFDTYRATPAGQARGAVVVVQEIFGVNAHIQAVARQFAEAGFLALAPALYDRIQRRADLPYSDVPAGRALRDALKVEQTLLDLKATIDAAATAGRVGMVGYCWGGTMAYVAACQLQLAAGICYYGGGMTKHLDRTPKCPVMFHFGERDTIIPASDVEQIRRAYPLGKYHVYPADHGFNCTERPSFDPPSAALALERTLEFLHRHVG
ncbi:MAG: dienelactone hydrolase family protein [Pseudomonadota bacterium]|nr:dienelactone hydrolase family protein [Pseudomonadota bacterium]